MKIKNLFIVLSVWVSFSAVFASPSANYSPADCIAKIESSCGKDLADYIRYNPKNAVFECNRFNAQKNQITFVFYDTSTTRAIYQVNISEDFICTFSEF